MDDSTMMDDSVFDVDEASSDFAPPAKVTVCESTMQCSRHATHTEQKAKAPAKKAAAAPKPKAAPKKAIQTTLKVPKTKAPATKKRPKPESDAENSDLDRDSANDASLLSNTPPAAKKQKPAPKKSSGKPLQSIENESFAAMDEDSSSKPKPKGKAATDANEKYQKISHMEHILLRPDTYIGSVERTEKEMWVFNSTTEAMEFRDVSFVPGLFKIFDEVLVNAADNKQNDKNMDEIKVTIDRESGEISVWNNGRGIPIEIHKVSDFS
jgi:DNA topoisomerase-2